MESFIGPTFTRPPTSEGTGPSFNGTEPSFNGTEPISIGMPISWHTRRQWHAHMQRLPSNGNPTCNGSNGILN